MPFLEMSRGRYSISTDPRRLDIEAVHAYLSRSYWAEGIPRDLVATSLAASLCFGLYEGARQIGFARVVTDRATFGYLCDVYVLEEHRGKGLGKWLMEAVTSHPELHGLRRFVLATRDAHGLYRMFGFQPLAAPESYMEVLRPEVYRAREKPGEILR